jgi:hypothetical protein
MRGLEMQRMSGKMIRTFDPKYYTDLLVRYQPKPIANEAENDAAIALACEPARTNFIQYRP